MKTAIPTAFPYPGVYDLGGMHVDLRTAAKNAVIHYTMDGSPVTATSPIYRRELGLLTIRSGVQQNQIDSQETVIRAVAIAPGYEASDEAVFRYRVDRAPHVAYKYRVIRQGTDHADIYCVEDFNTDKMYLLVGSTDILLLDCGYDADGDLAGYIRMLTGGQDFKCLIMHNHPDHNAQAKNFSAQGIPLYMNAVDEQLTIKGFDAPPVPAYTDIREGYVFDLGNTHLRVYETPGHTPGSLTLVEEETGYVFSSDSFGSGKQELPDSGFLQFGNPESAMDKYLSMIQNFRAKAGKLDLLFTGHNIYALHTDIYLDNLEKAAQKIVDFGLDGSEPTLRPAEESFGSSRVAVEGNYQVDLHAAIINLGLILSEGITPENNCKLSCVRFDGAKCSPVFCEDASEYTLVFDEETPTIIPTTSSTRAVLELNGAKCKSGESYAINTGKDLHLRVIAPDGKNSREYVFHRK